jgi:hypothetical protein
MNHRTASTRAAGEIRWTDDAGKKHYAWYYHAEPQSWGALHGFPFEVALSHEETRFARILATVAYIATDEDAEGNPVSEKWAIQRTEYSDER